MKTRAVRLYGRNDLRMEDFELPRISENEILASVITDSLCLSSYKAAIQGTDHKRVPKDIGINPVIIGHEFSGQIIEVGKNWKHKYRPGQKYAIQPAIYYHHGPVGVLSAPGYSYRYIGGDATYIIIPEDVLVQGCLLEYAGPGYYPGSLAEPLSCVIGAMNACYHTSPGSYIHEMGIKPGGKMAILAGAGPMGLAMINSVVHRENPKPSLCVVTDIDEERLAKASEIISPLKAKESGIDLVYINTSESADPATELKALSDGSGYDDVFLLAAVPGLIEQGDSILSSDGCLNFFAGPSDPNLKAQVNFYNVHYGYTHIAATSGGNISDMTEALDMLKNGLDPGGMITHIGGLNAVAETTLNLPGIPGGKKLIYPHIDLPLTPLRDFGRLGQTDPLFAGLDRLIKENNNFWSVKAENYLLESFRVPF